MRARPEMGAGVERRVSCACFDGSSNPVCSPASWDAASLLLAVLAFANFVNDCVAAAGADERFASRKVAVRSLAVSPDGRFIAMVLVKDGKQQIWIRALDALESAPLAGTDNAADPFWSPDSRFIAFFADAKLKKIDRSGGPVQTLCDALAVLGGTWNRNGDILIAALTSAASSEAGGAVARFPGMPLPRDLSRLSAGWPSLRSHAQSHRKHNRVRIVARVNGRTGGTGESCPMSPRPKSWRRSRRPRGSHIVHPRRHADGIAV